MGSIGRYKQLPFIEKKLFREALFNLYIIKFKMFFVSFKKMADTPVREGKKCPGSKEKEALLIARAIDRADRLALWKNRCLVKSLAAQRMLKKRGISSRLSLGVAFDQNKKLVAHAWISAGETEIVKKNFDYKELTVME